MIIEIFCYVGTYFVMTIKLQVLDLHQRVPNWSQGMGRRLNLSKLVGLGQQLEEGLQQILALFPGS